MVEAAPVRDDLSGVLVDFPPLAPRKAAQQLERLIDGDAAADADGALRLLNDDPAVQRDPKLLVFLLKQTQLLQNLATDPAVRCR